MKKQIKAVSCDIDATLVGDYTGGLSDANRKALEDLMDAGVKVGKPVLEGVKASAKVLEHGKGEKVVVFRYKPKKNIRTKNGHRQPYTKVQILAIG